MKIHEYQARRLLRDCGIPLSNAEAVFHPHHARAAFERLASPHVVVKVQVLAGGRGKAGGVQKAETAEHAERLSHSFLGKFFVTHQSGAGRIVKAVLISEEVPIAEEYYLGVAVDRSRAAPVILFSKQGGVEIEEVAASNPEAVQKIHFSPNAPPSRDLITAVIQKNFSDKQIPRRIAEIAERLAKLFIEKDAAICEINPLVLSAKNKVVALDAKIIFDDNALFRHPDIQALKDPDEEDERETRARQFGLSYVSMSGNVGCLVNGAGLAMATMDRIKLAGGEPANFLDVGGSATADQVREGFKIILQDERVSAILVNIFGGIMKCDVIADGVVQASREVALRLPLVVRLEGTRVEEGRALLQKSGLQIHSCADIREAAETAVREAKQFEQSHGHPHP